jgi:hypothetical protein
MRSVTAVLIIALLFSAPPAFAHHSGAMFDLDSTVNIEGRVSRYVWANPHVYLYVEARDNSGQLVEWQIEADPTPLMTRNGWTATTLAQGDPVALLVNPDRNMQRSHGRLVSLTKSDGITLARRSNIASPAVISAVSLSGVWGPLLGQTDTRRSYQAGTPTELGAAAQRAYTMAENPEALCIPEPTPASIDGGPYLHEIEIREDVIFIRAEYFGIERTVHMDGRGHPENGERTNQGHSIGIWEEDVLVVDTSLFADYRSGNLDGIPAGAQKHVVERYRLSPDRTQLIVEYFAEDPEFLASPISGVFSRNYTLDRELLPFVCDLENASFYLEN